MNGFSITVDKKSFREVEALFKRLNSSDKHELLDQMGRAAVNSTHINFDNEQSPDGKKWEKSLKAGGKTLQVAGTLRDSYTHNVVGDSTEVGSNYLPATIHHFGGVIKPKNKKLLAFQVNGEWVFAKSVKIPARPALGVNDDLEDDIRELTTVWLGAA